LLGAGMEIFTPTAIWNFANTTNNTSKRAQLTLKKKPDNPKPKLHFISSSSFVSFSKQVLYVYFEIRKHQIHRMFSFGFSPGVWILNPNVSEHSVRRVGTSYSPKRRHLNSRRRGTTQKIHKTFKNTAKV
jgi:hypothetical protein